MTIDSLRKSKDISYNNIFLKFFLLFQVSMVLGSLNVRMSQYIAPFVLVSVTVYLSIKNRMENKIIFLVTILLFLIYSFFIVFMGDKNFPFTEYKNIFNTYQISY